MQHAGLPFGALADHAGRFRIWLHCRCGHAKRFDATDLAERLGADYPNALLVERAKCERCGGRGASMTLEPIGPSCYAPQKEARALHAG